jgi:flagellar basal-body rod protein FlgF
MVDMISLARQFDMQIKLIERAESNDSKSSQLLATN